MLTKMNTGRDDDGDNLVWFTNEATEFEVPGSARERLQAGADPVHTIHTFNFVKEKLGLLVNIVGGEGAFQENWLINVDKDVLEGYKNLGIRREID